MIEEFRFGSGHPELITSFTYDTSTGNVEITRGARTIVIPDKHLLAFIAGRVRRDKKYDLEMMSDSAIIGLGE